MLAHIGLFALMLVLKDFNLSTDILITAFMFLAIGYRLMFSIFLAAIIYNTNKAAVNRARLKELDARNTSG